MDFIKTRFFKKYLLSFETLDDGFFINKYINHKSFIHTV